MIKLKKYKNRKIYHRGTGYGYKNKADLLEVIRQGNNIEVVTMEGEDITKQFLCTLLAEAFKDKSYQEIMEALQS